MFAVFLAIAFTQQRGVPMPTPPKLPPIQVHGDAPKPPEPGQILAKIDGVPLKAADVEPLLWDWRSYEVMQDLLSYRLAKQAADKANVSVTDAEVEAKLRQQLEQIRRNAPNQGSMDDWLHQQGYPQSRLQLRVKSELLLEKVALLEFKPDAYVKVSAITFHPESEMTPALAATINRADESYAKLQKGEKWESVLAESETNPNLIKSQGLVGWQALSTFPASVSKELAAIKQGQVTKPAQTAQGIQIFRLEARGAEATGPELESLKTTFLQGTLPGLANKLKASVKIERFYP